MHAYDRVGQRLSRSELSQRVRVNGDQLAFNVMSQLLNPIMANVEISRLPKNLCATPGRCTPSQTSDKLRLNGGFMQGSDGNRPLGTGSQAKIPLLFKKRTC
jgi:hypothetical protein